MWKEGPLPHLHGHPPASAAASRWSQGGTGGRRPPPALRGSAQLPAHALCSEPRRPSGNTPLLRPTGTFLPASQRPPELKQTRPQGPSCQALGRPLCAVGGRSPLWPGLWTPWLGGQGWTLRAALPRPRGQSAEAWAGTVGRGAAGEWEWLPPSAPARAPRSVPRRPLPSARPSAGLVPGLRGTRAATASCCLFRLVVCSFWTRESLRPCERGAGILGEDAGVWVAVGGGPQGFSRETGGEGLWVGRGRPESRGLAPAPPCTARKGTGLCGRGWVALWWSPVPFALGTQGSN